MLLPALLTGVCSQPDYVRVQGQRCSAVVRWWSLVTFLGRLVRVPAVAKFCILQREPEPELDPWLVLDGGTVLATARPLELTPP